jgi:hypothetical protein
MNRKLFIHFPFTLALKPSESKSGIGRTEKPKRTASQAIPKPPGKNGQVKDKEIPLFPAEYSVEEL